MNWFYSPDGSERFEVSAGVLLELIRQGKVTQDTLVWRDGLPDWTAAGAAHPEWFGPPPADLPPPARPEPPVELPPPVVGALPAADPADVSPWPRPTADSLEETAAPPPPVEVGPPPVEITELPPPPPPASETLPSLPPPAPSTPAYFPPTTPSQPRDSAALSSVISGSIALVGSLSGICCCFGPLVAMVAGVTAVVFGHMAYNKAKGHPEAERDKGLATVGLVLGYIAIAISFGSLLFGLFVGGLSGMMTGLDLP